MSGNNLHFYFCTISRYTKMTKVQSLSSYINIIKIKITFVTEFCLSARVEFTRLAAEYNVVNLGQGFPDFSPPSFILEAFSNAVNGGTQMHQYTRAFVRLLYYSLTCDRCCLILVFFFLASEMFL